MSSEIDVTFPANCADLGRETLNGQCEAFNQACCGAELPPPGPTCAGNCGGAAVGKACYCDSLCVEYGDCCDDYAAICQ